MTQTSASQAIASSLPYLRRYARALTGQQRTGDVFAASALEAIIADPSLVEGPDVRVELYRVFHTIWNSAGSPVEGDDDALRARAHVNMSNLTENTREALLLYAVEDFDYAQTARIIGATEEEARSLIDIARKEMAKSIRGNVLIIEDEALIAMDLENIVTDAGHRVFGVASTRDTAVDLGSRERPDLILADVHLADDSSGIDAVNDLLAKHGDIPVIFITAFPERLLTGDKPEPAFLISKPFQEEQVLSAISQAMFFASTETLS